MSKLKQTPLFPLYGELPGVRCIDFGGWELPVQFSGIVKEHEAVRQQAGLFDVSHMGEFTVEGADAEHFLQQVTTNDVSRLENGQAHYTLLCYPDGGVVDDLLIYKRGDGRYMLVVNASNVDKDWEWLQQHLTGNVSMHNISDDTALLALQGPAAADILASISTLEPASLQPFRFTEDVEVAGRKALISRTGYTGEDGFELYLPVQDAPEVWKTLLTAG